MGRIQKKLVVLLAMLCSTTAWAEVTITLKRSFVEKYKNRATISADFIVDHTKGKPNPPAKDGDMHVAGRSPKDIGLATVAEIMNAKDEPDAVQAANAAAATNEPLHIDGAWRIWNEHGGSDTQFIQGKLVSAGKDSNPDHVFEIHPITVIGEKSIVDSWRPIPGYTPKKAEDAFNRYENVRSQISVAKNTISLVSPGVGYNYVDFQVELMEIPHQVIDGAFAFANVQDFNGDLIVRKVRMVFVKGTPPYEAVSGKGEGACLRVLGIPRVDLAVVSWRAAHAKSRPDVLRWNLPYEMVVVAVHPEACRSD